MILAEKISKQRKKNGWSQEELAEKMQVSRQAVSKWESAGAIPDVEKILMLSRLFGVTLDYLLKDELEDEEFTAGNDNIDMPAKRVTVEQANEFMALRKAASVRIALAVFLCVIAAIPLLILCVASGLPEYNISIGVAAGVGLTALLVIVASAVAIFIYCDFKSAPFAFIDKEPFETEYGVDGIVRERQKAYRRVYVRFNVIGVSACILAPIPLFIGAFSDNAFFTVLMLSVTMLLAGIGVVFLIVAGVRWASMQKLLKEGEFSPSERAKTPVKTAVTTAYWLTVTTIYLIWSFCTDAWEVTWLVWAVGGVMYVVVMSLCGLLIERKK